MAGQRRSSRITRAGARPSTSAPTTRRPGAVPGVYNEMLIQAGGQPSASSRNLPQVGSQDTDPPRKRKRPLSAPTTEPPPTSPSTNCIEKRQKTHGDKVATSLEDHDENEGEGDDEYADLEFEDVPIPTIQTTHIDSDDEEDEDIEFEDVEIPLPSFDRRLAAPDPSTIQMELNLSAEAAATDSPRRTIERKKVITKEEKARRVDVHKAHLLCLMTHVARRNHWCNDDKVHDALKPLISDKMKRYLNPASNLPQFGRSESLKNGLKMVGDMFHSKFHITERGTRRALWAEETQHLENYKLPDDLDSTLEKEDYRQAALRLQGSRDVGAQLFCALLRSAGVRARLVCSLQPLPFAPGAPTLPKSTDKQKNTPKPCPTYKVGDEDLERSDLGRPSPIQRIGHSMNLNYSFMVARSRSRPTPAPASLALSTPKRIKESPFPIYWVEVLDKANQKWLSSDPIVTLSYNKPGKLEPPAADKENAMSYVMAFNQDGSARDVTRRYTKAFNAKTRRTRLEGLSSPTPGSSDEARNAGDRWLARVLAYFRPSELMSSLDQIEDAELNRLEAIEPMPKNLQDFKDHPTYALERHMRRHEVLVRGARVSGTVGAGQKGPLERIYRRCDVRVARSKDKWYRLGRLVGHDRDPVKVLPPQARKSNRNRWEDDSEPAGEATGTPLFTLEQTTQYRAPPVVNGRVPKNKFGNVDIYVPSMVPEGGVYIDDEKACRASFLLGIDYAPALVGFQFKGRQGTAVLRGAVVASEYGDAVRAAIQGMLDFEAELEQEARTRAALRMWRKFLHILRIRERIWAGAETVEEDGGDNENDAGQVGGQDGGRAAVNVDTNDEGSGSGEDDYGGGGFLVD